MRTYAAKIAAEHAHSRLTPTEIRAAKCQRSRERNTQRKAQRRVEADARQVEHDKFSLTEKIKRAVPGSKEHKRLVEQAA